MCGIIGYTGHENAREIIIKGLRALEYRGYDSAGIALYKEGKATIKKCKGRVENLEKLLKKDEHSPCAIGHTRWATHGKPDDTNAHPFKTENLSLVHNGIIENFAALKRDLSKKGITPISQTDSEVAALIIEEEFGKCREPRVAIENAEKRFEGSFAFSIIFDKMPDRIFAIRRGSPLILGKGERGFFTASDITALLPFTKTYYPLKEGEIAEISANTAIVFEEGKAIEIDWKKSTLSFSRSQKGSFDHFMLKEIYEQTEVVFKTLSSRTKENLPNFSCDQIDDNLFRGIGKIHIVACGSAYNAGLLGKNYIEHFGEVPVCVEIASEFRYSSPLIKEDDLVIIISQSGETADSIAALRFAKKRGVKTLGIVNVPESSIARESDFVILTDAGTEISVATTKGYTTQAAVLLLFSIKLGIITGCLTLEKAKELTRTSLSSIPEAISKTINRRDEIKSLAQKIYGSKSLFFIGRGIDSSLALEGSLKLKEISYIHSESYPAGELKHGTISLLCENFPVIAIATDKNLLSKTLSNLKECKARSALTFCLCAETEIPKSAADFIFHLPQTEEIGLPFSCITALQLLAYEVGVLKGCDIDKPRNLAKSVTVE